MSHMLNIDKIISYVHIESLNWDYKWTFISQVFENCIIFFSVEIFNSLFKKLIHWYIIKIDVIIFYYWYRVRKVKSIFTALKWMLCTFWFPFNIEGWKALRIFFPTY